MHKMALVIGIISIAPGYTCARYRANDNVLRPTKKRRRCTARLYI